MSRFSQFAASTPVGKVDQFLSGTTPNGYLQLNGQCVCKNVYSSLYSVVGDLEPPITDSITLCALATCGTSSCGYNWCCTTGAMSSWGPTCITKFTLNQGCQSGSSGGVYRMCYATADLQCGFLDACWCCSTGFCLCIGSDANVFSWHENGTYYVAAGVRHCGSSESRVILWNFTCKCFVNVFRAGGDQNPLIPIDNSRVVISCNGPYARCILWMCTPPTLVVNCNMGCRPYRDCVCNTVSSQHTSFCPNYGSAVRFSKCHCQGKEPYAMVAIGTTFCQTNYNSSYCCGILSWRFDTFQAKVDNGCCYFSSIGCCCPSAWNLPFNLSYQQRFVCIGSGVGPADFYLTAIPYWRYGCGPAYSCVSWFFASFIGSQVACLAVQTNDFPGVVCSSVDVQNSIISPSTGVVATNSGAQCLSGLQSFFYNEKTCKHWGRSVRYPCAFASPCTNAQMTTTNYDFCYCTGQGPISHGSSTNCSPLGTVIDPQKFTANTVPFNPGTCTCAATLYGVSTLGPTSPVFMLPNITSPTTGLAYYIKS